MTSPALSAAVPARLVARQVEARLVHQRVGARLDAALPQDLLQQLGGLVQGELLAGFLEQLLDGFAGGALAKAGGAVKQRAQQGNHPPEISAGQSRHGVGGILGEDGRFAGH